MALSEREQQMLEQMEQALRTEDPRFASQMNGTPRRPEDRRRILVGVLGALAGLALVIVGINVSMWVGVAGFVLIVAAIAYAATPRDAQPQLHVVPDETAASAPRVRRGVGATGAFGPRPSAHPSGTARPGRPGPTARRSGSFMERLEQRWENRRQQGGL